MAQKEGSEGQGAQEWHSEERYVRPWTVFKEEAQRSPGAAQGQGVGTAL